MTFTRRIRIYLIGSALIPPLTILAVVYLSLGGQQEARAGQERSRQMELASHLNKALQEDVLSSLKVLAGSRQVRRAILQPNRPGAASEDLKLMRGSLDFLEILGRDGRVVVSSHRPGLIGERKSFPAELDDAGQAATRATVEYDTEGRHAALTGLWQLQDGSALYGGSYFNEQLLGRWHDIIGARLTLIFAEDNAAISEAYARMQPMELYRLDRQYEAVLAGGAEASFFLTAQLANADQQIYLHSMFAVAGVVAALSVLLAILAGVYISGKARREIDNLVSATARVAEGDFKTPVMAFEEGEFSQLADSVSTMMSRLNDSLRKLAATEKIAAWEMVGRKIAHEIKNPLTPIAISADDLRRSYAEGLPDFDKTLENSCLMIRAEVSRLNRLLDEFVSFARMKPPAKTEVVLPRLLADFGQLYAKSIEEDRLSIVNRSSLEKILVDPEQFQQLLINLVKNSLETGENATVSLAISDDADNIRMTVEDNGPGFPAAQLGSDCQPSLSTKKEGSGLGLVICQRIVIDHGGSIELYNRSEGGAGVRIVLPVTHV